MSPNAPRRPVVIVQEVLSSSASSTLSTPTSTTSITRSNSVSSTHSSNTSTSSTSRDGHGQKTRPVRLDEGGREFVETGRPQGGNPHGGPPQTNNGYYRASNGPVTVHNTGGLLTGTLSADLGEAYANGLDHTDSCRKLSQKSDNTSLCFCIVGSASS
ncbi:hypothetical protein L873DRAFT_184005 [Choiromyces venosus 120613-1]|uniref:Uncharacterized protein n=1 Tax=Choiromyces venosus 120613-1 TaxID=1336337 RepID=A0A3N4J7W4_9PEZI|nr:hypothetical protein L873DRAFT_184005 [Choiromyces venosus 120613-1]